MSMARTMRIAVSQPAHLEAGDGRRDIVPFGDDMMLFSNLVVLSLGPVSDVTRCLPSKSVSIISSWMMETN
jgi:hypothetical protein